MYHRENPIAPTQSAITGALDIYVEGGRKRDPRQMLFGLSVLRHATEDQIAAAMRSVGANRNLTQGEIQAVLAE